MGLDIYFGVLNQKRYDQKIEEYQVDFSNIRLSRNFCKLLSREDVVDHDSELKQIGKLTQTDISPLEQLIWYHRKDQLILYNTEKEKKQYAKKRQDINRQLVGNCNKVKKTLELLISQLAKIENLPNKLIKTDYDSLNNKRYFSEFNSDLGDGYIGNNFGHDLRNLNKLVEFAKLIGEETVFLEYG